MARSAGDEVLGRHHHGRLRVVEDHSEPLGHLLPARRRDRDRDCPGKQATDQGGDELRGGRVEDHDPIAGAGMLTNRGADAARLPEQFVERQAGRFGLAVPEKDERVGIRADLDPPL